MKDHVEFLYLHYFCQPIDERLLMMGLQCDTPALLAHSGIVVGALRKWGDKGWGIIDPYADESCVLQQ